MSAGISIRWLRLRQPSSKAWRDAACVLSNLMIVETGVVVRSGPLSSPRERGPDLKTPRCPLIASEVGVAISTMVCGHWVRCKSGRWLRILLNCCYQGTCLAARQKGRLTEAASESKGMGCWAVPLLFEPKLKTAISGLNAT